jgi:hypothetical protein
MVVPKKNGKLRICVDFKKFNPYLLHFIDEVINTVIGHEMYTFLDDFLGYH